jgi:predicted dehydrogenase
MIQPKILVIGCGSIGERHLRCLLQTGRAAVAVCEVKTDLLERIRQQYHVSGFGDLQLALQSERWDAAIICTLANTHIDFALNCLARGLHVLIEKPLALGLERSGELHRAVVASGKFAAVGYVLHFLPCLKSAREHLRGGEFGKPLQVSVSTGQHFPTFRPAYREIYYARHETGGGGIQDSLTHNVNAVEWLLGPTTRVFCDAAHQALEGVSVEDTVCVTARNGEVLASYAHNQFQAPNETTYLIHCQRGSLKIEPHEQRWGVWPRGAPGWKYHLAPVQGRDDLFIAQANAFLDGIRGAPSNLCTIEEAIQTLKFNLAALQSWRQGVPVNIT